ncbi:hypothetical protein [Clostridium thailandense]|uniref:hypothetical protein n=1 Tax=Clostridium thailandense TaxID=2794346 RepID=UPI003988CF9B
MTFNTAIIGSIGKDIDLKISEFKGPRTIPILIAKGGGTNIAVTASAIIAGAYFSDRCSPKSSSASFVARLTEADIYNI